MAKKDEITSLEFDISLKPNKALAEIGRFGKGFTDRMKDAEKEVGKLDKGMLKFVKQFQATRKHSKDVQLMNRHYSVLGKTIDKDIKHILRLRKELKGSTGDDRKRKFAQIKAFTEARNVRGAITEKGKVKENLKAASESFDFKELQERAGEAGDALTAPLEELFRKDAPALFKRASGLLAFGLDKTLGKMAGNLQKKLMDKSHGAMFRAAQLSKSGAPGAASAASAAKGTANLFKGLGEVVGIFAKLGPIISIASSFMMSFVKILIDAEGAAKDYNKQILSTSGTSEFLHRSLGDASRGMEQLDDTLKRARDGAMGYTGVLDTLKRSELGITKDMASGFQNALSQEGVSLGQLDDAMKKSTGYSKDFASTVEMSVAYSRAFGVSLNELSQFQGQLMSDVGMGLDSVQKSFQMMANAANESGLSTSKFFGIVRSFSSDLGLFNLRMEDLTKTMKALSKSMDPREAQRYLQAINQRYKGGITENLKHAAVAGDQNLQKLGANELTSKLTSVLKEVASALGKDEGDPAVKALEALIRDPKTNPREIAKWKNKQDKQLDGKIMGAVYDAANFAKLQQTQVGRAANAATYSPFAKQLLQLEEIKSVMQDSSLTFADLLNVNQQQLLASEQGGAAAVEELKSATKFYQGVVTWQQDLVKTVGDGVALSRQQQDTLKQLKVSFTTDAQGIARGTAEGAKKLEEIFKGDKDLSATLASMDESQSSLMSDSNEELDFQKKTAKYQVSTMDQLGIISDMLMNQIFNILQSMLQIMKDIYSLMPGSAQSRIKSSVTTGQESQIAEVKDAFKGLDAKSTHKEMTDAKNKVIEGVGKRLLAEIDAAHKEYNELRDKSATETDSKKRKAMQDRMAQLKPAMEYMGTKDAKGKRNDFDLYKEANTFGVPTMLKTLEGMDKALSGARVNGAPLATVPAAATAPAAAAAMPAAVPMSDKNKPATESQQAAVVESTRSVERAVSNEGVKLHPSSVQGPLADTMAKSVYEGTSKALFEYHLYSTMDRSTFAMGLASGAAPAALAGTAMERVTAGMKNAEGGTVTGISDNLAKVARFPAAPAGEGWASVGPGEKILPAGAGGKGTVQVELVMKDDFKRFIDARVVDGAAKHDRNKRLR